MPTVPSRPQAAAPRPAPMPSPANDTTARQPTSREMPATETLVRQTTAAPSARLPDYENLPADERARRYMAELAGLDFWT